MIDRFLASLELSLLKNFPAISFSIRVRRNHRIKDERSFLDLVTVLQKKRLIIQSISEAYNLYRLCSQVKDVAGDIAELGVFKGGTARLLCEVKGSKRLHLFDTFETFGGMPTVRDGIDLHKPGDFSEARIEEVQRLLSDFQDVLYYPGVFPNTSPLIKNESGHYAFVHLDADIYQSTLDGLKYFYPRLSKGGMLVSHDYQFVQCPGVKKAFDEFFVDKPEPVIGLWDTQCLVLKA